MDAAVSHFSISSSASAMGSAVSGKTWTICHGSRKDHSRLGLEKLEMRLFQKDSGASRNGNMVVFREVYANSMSEDPVKFLWLPLYILLCEGTFLV